ncbi:MAG: 2-polyprenylphenol 6-hydroxylase [Alphaproteobacteria bacterium]
MLRSLRNSRRLITIAYTLAREDAVFIFRDLGFLPILTRIIELLFARHQPNKTKGQKLASALEKLGPAFIKLGQALSTRSDLIGDELAQDLSRLRDALPAFSTLDAKKIIESEFNGTLAELYKEFSDIPVAAASIAQVHKATTVDGKEVAVKILRPDIEKAFARDLNLFFWLAEILSANPERARRMKPLEVVRTLKESVFFELDLRFEAAAASELAENISKHECGLHVPAIDWSRTSRRVLTMEWVDGISLSDVEAIRASGHDINLILTKAATSLFLQVFKDGFFHADPHPGNLFLNKNGDLVLVDFGIMGRLDMESRIYIAEIMRGFLNEDYRHVAEVHFKAGYVPAGKSIDAFTQACMAVAKPITGKPLNEISVANLLGQMFKIATEFEMETQPQLLLMQKTLMVTEGVGRMLNPKLNMWELSRPIIERWAMEQFGAAGKLKEAARESKDILYKFPHMLRAVERAVNNLADPAGVKLHPATLANMNHNRRTQQRPWLVLGWVGVIAAILIVLLH